MQPAIEPDRAGIANADTNRGPFGVVDVGAVDDLLDAAAAGVDDDADAVALLGGHRREVDARTSAIASLPAPIARWMKRLIRRAILGSMRPGRVEVEDLGRDPDLERGRVEAT